MRERIATGIQNVKDQVNQAAVQTGVCLIDNGPAGTTALFTGLGAYDLAKGNMGIAAAEFTVAAAQMAVNNSRARRRRRDAFESGFNAGIESSGMLQDGRLIQIFGMGPEGQDGEITPIYESLDGETKIIDPTVLLDEFTNPRKGAMRVIRLVSDSGKRDLTLTEIETLRRADAAMGLLPGMEQSLCDRGQTTVADMRSLTKAAEEKYKDEHPTVIDMSDLDHQA